MTSPAALNNVRVLMNCLNEIEAGKELVEMPGFKKAQSYRSTKAKLKENQEYASLMFERFELYDCRDEIQAAIKNIYDAEAELSQYILARMNSKLANTEPWLQTRTEESVPNCLSTYID